MSSDKGLSPKVKSSVGAFEWYRKVPYRRLVTMFCISSAMLSVGSIAIGLSWVLPVPDLWRVAVAIVGGSLTVAGPLSAFLRIPALLRHDDYIALTNEGILRVNGQEQVFYPWDLVVEAMPSQDNPVDVELIMREGEVCRVPASFDALTPAQLARVINRVRTKALWNTL